MTVLSALQSTAIRCIGQKPTSIFSASSGIALELSDLVNEAAKDILKAHEWTALTALQSSVGDGTTQAFPLPADFDRWPKKVSIFTTQWPGVPYQRARDLDEWYFNRKFVFAGVPGWWLVQSGKLNIYPAPAATVNVEYYYISKNLAKDNAETAKSSFTADDDTFVLSERLLTLACIWRWKSMKGMEYAEHMNNYEIALSQEVSNDKGPRILADGRRRIAAPSAYPGVLGAGGGEAL